MSVPKEYLSPPAITYENLVAGKIGFDDLEFPEPQKLPSGLKGFVAQLKGEPQAISAHDRLHYVQHRKNILDVRKDRWGAVRKVLLAQCGGPAGLKNALQAAPQSLRAASQDVLEWTDLAGRKASELTEAVRQLGRLAQHVESDASAKLAEVEGRGEGFRADDALSPETSFGYAHAVFRGACAKAALEPDSPLAVKARAELQEWITTSSEWGALRPSEVRAMAAKLLSQETATEDDGKAVRVRQSVKPPTHGESTVTIHGSGPGKPAGK